MIYNTGCIFEPKEITAYLRSSRAYLGESALDTVIQNVHRIHTQPLAGSCVGESIAAGYHGIIGVDVSGIQIWIGSRRRANNLYDASVGASVSNAIFETTARGLALYKSGEEQDSAAFTRLPCLHDELDADTRRVGKSFDHHVLIGSIGVKKKALVDALKANRIVIWTTGVTEAFMNHQANMMVQDEEVGADDNGHAMRVFGYIESVDAVAVQNSWGQGFGGMVVQGTTYRGCVLVPATLLFESAREVWVIQVTR
jgi:hypothetical protein